MQDAVVSEALEQAQGTGGGVSVAEQWQLVRQRLRGELGDEQFSSWFSRISFTGVEDGVIKLTSSSRFIADWIASHFAEQVVAIWSVSDPSVFSIKVTVQAGPATAQSKAPCRPNIPTADYGVREDVPVQAQTSGARGAERGLIGASFDPRYRFENFVVGKSNQLAHAAARRVAESPKVTFNPLFLYSSVGLGKTHLMHAIAWEIRQRHPERKVLYMSAETFMYEFVQALRFKDMMAFKQHFRAVDVLMIDDVQFMQGKESTQEEFFHTFNALVDNNRQVVISADRSPSALEGLEERIRSRLGWGLVADIDATDYELRLGILQQRVDALLVKTPGLEVPVEVMEFVAGRISSSVRELEGALTRIVAHSQFTEQPISLDLTREVLRDLVRANDRKITIDLIQRGVSEYYNLRLTDMLSSRRARAVARPRQVAMYLAKQLTPRSLPEIGRKFGGRDHTTVMYAVRKIEELCEVDGVLREDVERLRRQIEG